ncbi:MAG: NUDIX domain-containing protein [Candidatus Diapherotrites archaeon]
MSNIHEIFDLVNENNEVIGQEERWKVHKKRLWHRAVYIFIFNKKGELLLQKRSMDSDTSAGLWTASASGHLGTEKDYLAAAKRELKEEIGIEIPIKKIGAGEIDNSVDRMFFKLYSGKYDGKFKIQEEELSKVKFFTVDEIKKMVEKTPEKFSPNFRVAFGLYIRNIY